MTAPTQTRTALAEQLLAAVIDGEGDVATLVSDLAASDEALAGAVSLAARLATLPGDHARHLEARLDAILDAVTLVAESRFTDSGQR